MVNEQTHKIYSTRGEKMCTQLYNKTLYNQFIKTAQCRVK